MQMSAVITSRTNAKVKLLRAAFDGKASEPGDLVGIEGEHLLAEALRSGLTLPAIFLREGSERTLDRKVLHALEGHEITVLSREVFAAAVDTASPQGIAATAIIPDLQTGDDGLTLVLEDLQDPGNLGTLIRSVEAFGGGRVLATRATVNAWSPKVIRSSAGSVFRVPVERLTMPQIRKRLQQGSGRVYAAVAQERSATSLLATKFSADAVLLIGNEGAGLSGEALAMADERVWIPCATESLNAAVAGSVLLYEAMRQRGTP
jgi:TrmH family RNA methyltransferase